MASSQESHSNPTELAWLSEASEAHEQLNESNPIWVKQGSVYHEKHIKGPQWHPYCELNIILEGEGIAFVENEQYLRSPGEILLLGPGIPHWGKIVKFPLQSITTYFLPSLLIEMGPQRDGIRFLRRFTAPPSRHDRITHPPPNVFNKIKALARQSVVESENNLLGSEARLRTLFIEQLITLLRWEESEGRLAAVEELSADWRPIMKALQYLREHYSEPIYATELSRCAGVSESTLKLSFQKALGLSWVKYLQGYRVNRAAALLNESGHNVTQAALDAGFESLAHFNKTFRFYMGVSPSNYRKGGFVAPDKISKLKR
jgi:AraC-like DNA-binding protein/mannose-6-phosphate isomerase-like protein (cupin superfamily)